MGNNITPNSREVIMLQADDETILQKKDGQALPSTIHKEEQSETNQFESSL